MQTFRDAVARGVAVNRNADALVCDSQRLTYQGLLDRLERLHGGLNALGLAPGDRVAVLSFNSVPFVELYLGISMAGYVQVPLNFRWAEPELAYALDDSGARVLFCDRDPGDLANSVERVIRLDLDEYDAWVDDAEPTSFDGAGPTENDLAGLFYTGGTTGASKGVMLTHRNLVANAWNMMVLQPMTEHDRYLLMAPTFHAAGSISLLQSLFVGATQVIMPAFDPATMLDLVEAEGITQSLGVPTMVAATVEEQLARPRDVSSFTTYAHGGSPIALEVVRRGMQAFPGAEFLHIYGATETSPAITGMRNEQLVIDDDRGKSAGQPVVGNEVTIRDQDGNVAPTGTPGEVTVRGANVMSGYWNKAEQTASVLRDGWYSTGDVGRLDDAGYLFLLDRSKDMIVSGGENVYCTEVEDALYTHPAVLEATVFGIPHETWGEAVHAVVVLRDGATADEATLVEHCRSLIGGYKVPRSIGFRTEPLPKSGPGKVLKRELRDPFWADRDSAIG